MSWILGWMFGMAMAAAGSGGGGGDPWASNSPPAIVEVHRYRVISPSQTVTWRCFAGTQRGHEYVLTCDLISGIPQKVPDDYAAYGSTRRWVASASVTKED